MSTIPSAIRATCPQREHVSSPERTSCSSVAPAASAKQLPALHLGHRSRSV
jgi:hypothetical protein